MWAGAVLSCWAADRFVAHLFWSSCVRRNSVTAGFQDCSKAIHNHSFPTMQTIIEQPPYYHAIIINNHQWSMHDEEILHRLSTARYSHRAQSRLLPLLQNLDVAESDHRHSVLPLEIKNPPDLPMDGAAWSWRKNIHMGHMGVPKCAQRALSSSTPWHDMFCCEQKLK